MYYDVKILEAINGLANQSKVADLLGIFFLGCSTIIGVARIFVGVHWLSDILGGIIFGWITGYIVYILYSKIICVFVRD